GPNCITRKCPAPVQVSGLGTVTAIAAGRADFSLALQADGSVMAWGENGWGELGNGTTSTSGCYCITTPAPVSGLSGVTAVVAGYRHSLALDGDGNVWAWGLNDSGQLGNGGAGGWETTPVQVSGLAPPLTVAAGGY